MVDRNRARRVEPDDDDGYDDDDAEGQGPTHIEVDAPARKYEEADQRRAKSKTFGALSVEDFDLDERSTTVSMALAGGRTGSLSVTYRPSELKDATTGAMRDMSDAGDYLAAAEIFCRTVTAWGLMGPIVSDVLVRGEDGKPEYRDGRALWVKETFVERGDPVPLDPEIVQYCPQDVIVQVWAGLNADFTDRRKKTKDSRKPSRSR